MIIDDDIDVAFTENRKEGIFIAECYEFIGIGGVDFEGGEEQFVADEVFKTACVIDHLVQFVQGGRRSGRERFAGGKGGGSRSCCSSGR